MADEFKCVPREGEPSFTLLGRDPHAPGAIRRWATARQRAISRGEYPASDYDKVVEARRKARLMEAYYAAESAKK